MLEKLKIPSNSKSKRKRVGRGSGSTLGKTSGKGHKGQNSRSGGGVPVGFEGGQMPIYRRLPKRGFTNIFRIEKSIINIDDIQKSIKLDKSKIINRESLCKAGILKKNDKRPIKLLSNGKLDSALNFELEFFSKQSQEKIKKANGSVKFIKK